MYKLLVGFGRADITPLESCHMGGLGDVTGTRMSTDIREPLHTNCIAITDEKDETVLLIVNDLCQIIDFTGVKEPIVAATGVPADHIFICATHTHSAPAMSTEMPQSERYRRYTIAQMAVAAATAMIDRKPAAMEAASVQTQNMNFSRRYINSEGKPYANNKGMTMVGPESQADPQLQLIKFKREGGKNIILTNFQTHHHGEAATKWYTAITSNFFGVYRAALEEKTGCHVAYFSGAGGNLAAYNIYEKHLNVTDGYRGHGVRLAEYAMEGKFVPVEAGPIQVMHRVYTCKTRKQLELLEVATRVRDVYEATNDRQKAMEEAKGYPISSIHHAGAICRTAKMADTFDVTLAAISVGGLGIATGPCEMYDINGKYVKDHSPCQATLVFQLCNGSVGYIPAECAYQNGGYEIDTTRYQKGTAEGFQNTFLDMLREMKEN